MNSHRRPHRLTLFLATALALLVSAALAAELPVLVHEDFETGSARWQPTDPRAWSIVEVPGGRAFGLVRQSSYSPPHRSPLNIALLKDIVVADFALEADVQSTVKDYDHRDMVMVFGYQDPAHFYYVHFGNKADDHANQIFIVNNAPRAKISLTSTPGTPWDDAWHKVKITRTAADGDIKIYFDDMQHPKMTARDKTFAWGQVGIGSFDDLGNVDNVSLRGTIVKPAGR